MWANAGRGWRPARPAVRKAIRNQLRVSTADTALVGRTISPEPRMNEHDLLTEARHRTDPTERAAFLDKTCAGDSELRRRLEELLAGYAESVGPLDRPPVAPAESTATAGLPTPIATGEHRPDWATEAFARPNPDASTAKHEVEHGGRPAEHRGQPEHRAGPAGEATPRRTRLIDLSTATNKPDDVKKTRAERAKYPDAARAPGKK